MRIKETRNVEPPAGSFYCYTKWGTVIHISDRNSVSLTLCGNEWTEAIPTIKAITSQQSICNGCNFARYEPKVKIPGPSHKAKPRVE